MSAYPSSFLIRPLVYQHRIFRSVMTIESQTSGTNVSLQLSSDILIGLSRIFASFSRANLRWLRTACAAVTQYYSPITLSALISLSFLFSVSLFSLSFSLSIWRPDVSLSWLKCRERIENVQCRIIICFCLLLISLIASVISNYFTFLSFYKFKLVSPKSRSRRNIGPSARHVTSLLPSRTGLFLAAELFVSFTLLFIFII